MFYLLTYYRYIPLVVAFLLVALGAVRVLRRRSLALVKQTAAQYRPFREKRLLWLLILLALLLNSFMVPLSLRQHCTAEISLNYAEASRGLNPNKTRYNQANILSNEVLAAAIEKGALQDVTVQDLKKALTVNPKVQGSVEDASGYFISTQSILSYQATPETAHLDGETLVGLVAEAYKTWFLDTYSDNVAALELDFTAAREEDYLDVCRRLREQAEVISIYMGGMTSRETSFQSLSTGETFRSVASQADEVADVMVERLEAYVLENDISKQTDAYLSRLSFQNAFHYFDALRANRNSRNNLAAVSKYEDDMARIVLVPTVDTNFQFYMSQTRIGIDDFAKQADTQAGNKAEVRSSIARNNHILQQLSRRTSPDGADEKAEQLIAQIENELGRLAGLARLLVEEYNESHANEYISLAVSRLENQVFRVAAQVLGYTLLFAVGCHCVCFAAELAGGGKPAGVETARRVRTAAGRRRRRRRRRL